MTRSATTYRALAPAACGLALSLTTACTQRRFEPPPESVTDNVPRQVEAAAALARDAQRLELAGKTDEAIEKYRQSIQAYNELPTAWNNLGRLLAKQGDNLKAAEAFQIASEISPSDPIALYNLGTLWEDMGYLEEAKKFYDQSLARNDRYQPALRRSILVDDLRNETNEITAERLKTAMLAEREPWWINRFKRIQQRMQEDDITRRLPK